jgi:hypothetical protein
MTSRIILVILQENLNSATKAFNEYQKTIKRLNAKWNSNVYSGVYYDLVGAIETATMEYGIYAAKFDISGVNFIMADIVCLLKSISPLNISYMIPSECGICDPMYDLAAALWSVVYLLRHITEDFLDFIDAQDKSKVEELNDDYTEIYNLASDLWYDVKKISLLKMPADPQTWRPPQGFFKIIGQVPKYGPPANSFNLILEKHAPKMI